MNNLNLIRKQALGAGMLAIGLSICMGFVTRIQTTQQFSLQEILKDPTVSATVKSIGGYSGDCVELQIKSNEKNFNLTIPQGTLFYPEDDGEQTLVAPIAKVYDIRKNQPQIIKLAGYCTEASDRSPRNGGKFKVGMTQDTAVLSLVNYFNKNGTHDKSAIQEAVWSVTDRESIANVYLEDDVSNTALRNHLSQLTNQPLPWHNARRNIETDENGYISRSTTKVFANVSFANETPTSIKSKVVNAEGVTKYESGNSYKIPKAYKVNLKFELEVSGWQRGKYAVIYYNTLGDTVLKKLFTL